MNPKRVRGYRNDNDNTNDNGAEIRKKPMCKKKRKAGARNDKR